MFYWSCARKANRPVPVRQNVLRLPNRQWAGIPKLFEFPEFTAAAQVSRSMSDENPQRVHPLAQLTNLSRDLRRFWRVGESRMSDGQR